VLQLSKIIIMLQNISIKKVFGTFYSSKNPDNMVYTEILISIFKLFLKDHVTQKTGVLTAITGINSNILK